MSDLDQQARDVLDSVRYVVLATLDEDGRPRTSPVYFTPDRYARLYWVSHPDAQHSANLHRDPRASGVVFDSTRPPGEGEAVYVTGTAHEIGVHELATHVPVAFDPARRPALRARGAARRRRPEALGPRVRGRRGARAGRPPHARDGPRPPGPRRAPGVTRLTPAGTAAP